MACLKFTEHEAKWAQFDASKEVRLVYVTYPVWGATEGTKANAGALRAVSSPADQAGPA